VYQSPTEELDRARVKDMVNEGRRVLVFLAKGRKEGRRGV
jgi:hypothetical protein